MPVFVPDVASRAEKAARHFLAGQTATVTRATTTRSKANNKARNKGKITYKSAGERFDVSEAIVKKYVMLIRDKKPLPTRKDAHRPNALTEDEDKALNIVVQIADRGHFPINNETLVSLANQLRDQRLCPPSTSLHKNWPIEWRKKHPEFEFKAASFKDVKRMSAETQLEGLEAWFKEVKAVYDWQERLKRRMEAEAQKQNPRRHVAIGDGAYTKEALDAKVAARREVDIAEGLKETQKASLAFIKKVAIEENPGLKQWPPQMRAWKAAQPEWDFDAFMASIEDEEDKRFEETGKATYPTMKEDFVPFKTYSKKRSRKIRRGSSSSVEIILGNEAIVPNELPTMPRHVHLVGSFTASSSINTLSP
ncbi:hypothetical protein QBC32DRAFT_322447 [Pseudoneurospora amorphoporcata]|uniref:HTH CENPB-type domain-containing protein n=1 Tax=Pseudoneurospora amorphoporcata TaxID=241081 RepID=A0AAN6SHJ8_9PEZI|nr:hypothetical protein QBC32DRAFT_322447 [Pseudoneurospora amorphoporcata]